jgi:hypothetical protein
MIPRIGLALAAAIGILGTAPQEPGPLQKSLEDLQLTGAWVYNDLPAGFAEAKTTGKPLLIVFR